MVSREQLGTMLKACGLALVLVLIAALYIRSHVSQFAHALNIPLPAAIAHVGDVVMGGLLLLLIALGAFALVDVPLQRYLWARRLRMSHTEVKQESKDAEGNGEVKSKIKVRMREMANRRMLAAVPRADVVVTNPTHFAVALKYEEGSMAAPRVVAKGADLMAHRIREAARTAQVPVLEAPPLARALYAHVEVDREIPAALFSAVAQVLAWVYQLRAALNARGAARLAVPPMPTLEVPAELDPHHGRPAVPDDNA
jgi:flagellar biosynthetic protein FlhB